MEADIYVRPGVGTTREAPIRNRHFDQVDKRSHSEISDQAQNSSPGVWSQAVDAIAYGHLFAQTGIPFYSVIGIAYKTTIRNRHSETPDAPLSRKATTIRNRHSKTVDWALVSRNSVPAPKFRPGVCFIVHRQPYPSIGRRYLFARGSEPPARPQFGIGTSTRSVKGRIRRFPVRLKIPLRERGRGPSMRSHTNTSSLKRAQLSTGLSELLIRPQFGISTMRRPTPAYRPRDSLDYANRGRSPHTEPACHGDRKSCSTLREISSPAKELRITFRPRIGIANVTTIRNRHSETVDRALVSRNSVPTPKFRPRTCVIVFKGHSKVRLLPLGRLRSRKTKNPSIHPLEKKATAICYEVLGKKATIRASLSE
ncbi:hypothetical protein Taro_055591 [Colocasia esculenta]|uniref:Uncharacterized protein n=1 Tax=Colocasia esculenta TaxID=4460 RepID=A0A843XRE2_COLES|nr:hypothetical protein [Colocasia esculenta]